MDEIGRLKIEVEIMESQNKEMKEKMEQKDREI